MSKSPTVEDALLYSRNYAEAAPYLSKTAKAHIEGLCNLLEATQRRLREPLEAIEHALKMGFPASEVLDENSPIRDGIRAALGHND